MACGWDYPGAYPVAFEQVFEVFGAFFHANVLSRDAGFLNCRFKLGQEPIEVLVDVVSFEHCRRCYPYRNRPSYVVYRASSILPHSGALLLLSQSDSSAEFLG
jgi:hypothetical protein